jgi:polyvinyl alcohol dehydrogenase (cytochrome)
MKVAGSKFLLAVSGAAALLLTAATPQEPAFAKPVAQAASDASAPGKPLFDRYCAGCHNGGDAGAPSTDAIRRLSRADIKYNLELGYMAQIAKGVPRDDLAKIIDWLPLNPEDNSSWAEKHQCVAGKRAVVLDKTAARTATSFGLGEHNNRRQTAAQVGLKTSDMKNLELAWVMAFPQSANMRSQPLIVGKTLFFAATDPGKLFALDVASGCVKWSYSSDLTLRSSLAFAEATKTSPALIVMGDAAGRIHAVNAKTGAKAWLIDAKLTPVNRVTGAPVVHNGVIYAPLSAIEVNYAGPDNYECCKGQGALVALDQTTGKTLWVGRTMEDAKPTQKGRTGVQQWGPSGAIMWDTPIIDAKRNQIYIGTGENNSWPATDTSDAIIAYDMKTGARKWVFQATKADIWNYACGGQRGANCDYPGAYQSPDFDFGATPMLITLKTGKDMVVAGQKAGVLWALDPDTGKLIWSNKVARGSAGGGMRWGLAYDGEHIFAPQNDATGAQPGDNPNWGPGLHAVNAVTGEIDWSYKPNTRDCGDPNAPVAQAMKPTGDLILPVVAPVPPPPRPAPSANGSAPRGGVAGGRGAAPANPYARCRIGLAAAPIIVDGAVVTGSNGGMLRIFDAKTGAILFEYQTNKPYPNTINGMEGQGGSLDSAPYVAGNGTLFVQSGYSRFGQPPGNVLLAFRPKGKTAAK